MKNGQNTLYALAYIIDLICLLIQFIWPIIIVWRWSLIGVFVGAISTITYLVISVSVTTLLRSQHFNSETVEYWIYSGYLICLYCLLILCVKFIIKFLIFCINSFIKLF